MLISKKHDMFFHMISAKWWPECFLLSLGSGWQQQGLANMKAVIPFLFACHTFHAAAEPKGSLAWRLVNGEEVDVVWRVRSLQFFSDQTCSNPINAVPNVTGEAMGSEASDMTDAMHVFALRSMRGFESAGPCAKGECNVGFEWNSDQGAMDVQCLLIQQGETGLHAGTLTLQKKHGEEWQDVVSWSAVEGGRSKLAVACPSTPSFQNGVLGECIHQDDRSKVCPVTCSENFGAVDPRLQCINGAWFVPECLPVGTLMRVVAQAPERIKPYWVILDVALYRSSECTDVIRMDGSAISSGEYVIKYANYHAVNAWDGNADTSWASADSCTPGSCYIGFRFHKPVHDIRCVRIEHPAGQQYQATQVTVETLGVSGWEQVSDVTVRLLPQPRQEL
jgi:hypothetical protein